MEILIPVIIVSAIGLAAGLILALSGKYLNVPTDPRIEKVRDALPGANCGGCGFSGCDGYAEAIVNGGADISLCGAGGADTAKAISSIMGVDAGDIRKRVAAVHCRGTNDCAKERFEYRGLDTCKAANMLSGGPLACSFGCIGLGDCVRVCEHDAIHVNNGAASVDTSKCTACMKCVAECPRKIITASYANSREVLCKSAEKGAQTRKVCSAGCIGCGKCAKACEHGAVKIENFLAQIDPSLCTGCGKCESECPVKVISKI